MPFKTDIDHDTKCVRTTATGQIGFAEVKGHWDLLAASGAAAYAELVDACAASVAPGVSTDDIRRAAGLLQEMVVSGGMGRSAVVVDDDNMEVVCNELAARAGSLCPVRVFRDMCEALVWLGWQ